MSRTYLPQSSLYLLLLLAILAGCAGREIVFAEPPAVELASVPFYPQDAYQCGPAALATVLDWSGAEVDLASLVDQVYVPGRRGSLQSEVLAAARRAERIPYPVPPAPASLGAELAAGHPVLVLQNLGLDSLPQWHFSVVVGYDPVEAAFILRSGTEKTRRESVQRFMASWQRADFWGVVVLSPGQLPASQSSPDVLARALASAEMFLPAETASRAWRRLRQGWPEDDSVLFGSANALRRAGDHPAAAEAYAGLLRRQPDHLAARNNLADLLLESGCATRGMRLLEDVDTENLEPGLARAVVATRRALEASIESESRDKPPAACLLPALQFSS